VYTSEDKNAQKRLELVCEASLWVAVRSNDRQIRSDWGVTSGIRADPCDFSDAYESVEKDMVAYGSGTLVRTYDTWVLWEEHGMIRILLTGCMVRVCQYRTYERGQEGMFLA
jgi:hypothetical protein